MWVDIKTRNKQIGRKYKNRSHVFTAILSIWRHVTRYDVTWDMTSRERWNVFSMIEVVQLAFWLESWSKLESCWDFELMRKTPETEQLWMKTYENHDKLQLYWIHAEPLNLILKNCYKKIYRHLNPNLLVYPGPVIPICLNKIKSNLVISFAQEPHFLCPLMHEYTL